MMRSLPKRLWKPKVFSFSPTSLGRRGLLTPSMSILFLISIVSSVSQIPHFGITLQCIGKDVLGKYLWIKVKLDIEIFLGTTRSWTPPTWAWRIGQGSLQTLVKTLIEDECFIRHTVCVLKTFSKFCRNIFSNVEQELKYFPRVCLLLVRWNSGSAW